jgi:hypothetical protein
VRHVALALHSDSEAYCVKVRYLVYHGTALQCIGNHGTTCTEKPNEFKPGANTLTLQS